MVKPIRVASRFTNQVLGNQVSAVRLRAAEPDLAPGQTRPGPGPAPAKVTMEEAVQKQRTYPSQVWHGFAVAFLGNPASKSVQGTYRGPVEALEKATRAYLKDDLGSFDLKAPTEAAFKAVGDSMGAETLAMTVLKAFEDSWSRTLTSAMQAVLPDKFKKHQSALYGRLLNWKVPKELKESFGKAAAEFNKLATAVRVQTPGEEKAPSVEPKAPDKPEEPDKTPGKSEPVTRDQEKMLKEMLGSVQGTDPRWRAPDLRVWFFRHISQATLPPEGRPFADEKTWALPYEKFKEMFERIPPADRDGILRHVYRYFRKVK